MRRFAGALAGLALLFCSGMAAAAQSNNQSNYYDPDTVIIRTSERMLYYIDQYGRTVSYPIAVGRAGMAWSGTASIALKREWPTWTPPAQMIEREAQRGHYLPVQMPGGLNNPLGAAALYLFQGGRDTLYRIHGTNEPGSIGRAVSSGCIRMLNEDVQDLYARVRIGTTVVVE